MGEIENQQMLKAQETSRGKANTSELEKSMEAAKARWEASVKAINATEAEVAAIEASIAGVSADSEGDMQKLRDELASLQAQAAKFADVAERTKAAASGAVSRTWFVST